jgi:hypothetical protein
MPNIGDNKMTNIPYTIKGLLDDIAELKFENKNLHRILDGSEDKLKCFAICMNEKLEDYDVTKINLQKQILINEEYKTENYRLTQLIIKMCEEKYLMKKE